MQTNFPNMDKRLKNSRQSSHVKTNNGIEERENQGSRKRLANESLCVTAK